MKKKKIILLVLFIMMILIILSLSVAFLYITNAIKSVKNMNIRLTNNEYNYSKIFDANGNELTFSEKLEDNYIPLDQINMETRQAFLSIEDKQFYKHKGLNYKRIAKAMLNNLKSKNLGEGASTITQQLVKNRFLTNEKTFDRKLKEAYLSKKLEKIETKDKILETYLNTIYFGNGAYGIGNASKTYFSKKPSELTLSESCVLAGCIKSPNNYSPINNMENAIKRKNIVLKEMLNDGKISNEEYSNALSEEIDISKCNISNTLDTLDLYSRYVLEEASKILNTNISNVLHGGYKIYTYQDLNQQNILNKTICDDKYYHKNRNGNIADSLAIIIDNSTYGVSAIAGRSKYNLVDIKRQPGSLIKPILTYAPALNEGLINSKTQILDEKIEIDGYSPNNVGNVYHGYVAVEDAVAQSLNIPTIKLTMELGLEKCKSYAKKCRIKFNDEFDNNLAIALGGFTDGITLKDLTDSYSVLTNKGNYTNSNFIKKINNSNNMTIYNRNLTETNVFSSESAYLMTDILKYSVENGTSKKLSKLGFNVAGKTGTVAVKGTNLNTDVYSLAYTNDYTISTWLGNYTMQSDYHLEGKNNGGTYATEMIKDVLENIYKNKTPTWFDKPNGVEEIIIDIKTLNELHEVVLGDNVPERFQTKCLINSKFKPINSSTIFEKLDEIILSKVEYKNSIKLSFDAKDYNTYEIFRKSTNNYNLIKTVKDFSGTYEYIDTNIQPNTNYTYYVKAKSNYSSAETNSNKVSIVLKKEYKDIVNNNSINDFAWLFT